MSNIEGTKMSSDAKATVLAILFVCAFLAIVVVAIAATTAATSGPQTCVPGRLENGKTVYYCD